MNITLRQDQQFLIYQVPKSLDALVVRECRQLLEEQLEVDKKHHVFDFSETEFIDSSGIGAVVFLYKRLKARGKSLRIVGLNGQPEEIVKMLRVDRVIKTYKSLEEVEAS